MTEAKLRTGAISLLRSSVDTLVTNKVILFPFLMIAFVQLLVLEILYFAPRPPLSNFFGPVITKFWSAKLMHYPYNMALLPKMFQLTQIPIFIFISSFFICVAIAVIFAINSGQKVQMKQFMKETFGSYVHIVLAAILSFLLIIGFLKLYNLIFIRALQIQSQTGVLYWLKTTVITGASYFYLIFSIVVTTLFAYIFPIIVIEKKKIFAALILNFKTLWGSFWSTFFIVFIPSLLYLIVISLRKGIPLEASFPEMRVVVIVLSIFILIMIDAVIYTALTIRYLLKKNSL